MTNRISRFRARAAGMTTLILAVAAPLQAETRSLSLPDYLAHPGSILEVPLSLDNASGLAALKVQINFDPDVLELLAVMSGPLGDAFEMSQGDGDGIVQLVFARGETLLSGTGRLAVLRFHVNEGTVEDLYSELAIADVSLSDSTGVIDLRQKDTVTTTSGRLIVTMQPNIDNEHNALPDWWEEQHGLDLFAANASLDTEHDGMNNLLEYAFGGNPTVADARERGAKMGLVTENGQLFLTLEFYRRTDDSGLGLHLQESGDLGPWYNLNLAQQFIDVPQDMGDGTEFVRARGTIPIAGENAGSQGFLRLKVERP